MGVQLLVNRFSSPCVPGRLSGGEGGGAENERLRDRLRSLEGRAVYNHNQLEYLRHLSQEEPLIRLEYDLFKIDRFPSNPYS